MIKICKASTKTNFSTDPKRMIVNRDSLDCFVIRQNIQIEFRIEYPLSPVHSSKVQPRVFDRRQTASPLLPGTVPRRHSCISTGAPWHLDDIKMKFVWGERREKILVSVFEERGSLSPSFHGSKRIETKTGRKRVWTPLMGFVDEEKNERRPTVVGIMPVDPIKSDVS